MDTSEFFKSTRISKVSNLVEIDNKVGGGDWYLPEVLCCPRRRCNWRFIWALVFPGRQLLSKIAFQSPTPNFMTAFRKVSDSSLVQPGERVQFHKLAESLYRRTLRMPDFILWGLGIFGGIFRRIEEDVYLQIPRRGLIHKRKWKRRTRSSVAFFTHRKNKIQLRPRHGGIWIKTTLHLAVSKSGKSAFSFAFTMVSYLHTFPLIAPADDKGQVYRGFIQIHVSRVTGVSFVYCTQQKSRLLLAKGTLFGNPSRQCCHWDSCQHIWEPRTSISLVTTSTYHSGAPGSMSRHWPLS
jgi:hypothetical protein